MNITSPTLDNGTRATPEFRRNETQVGFEMVSNIEEYKPRKPGFFSSLFRVLGGLSPLGMFFGPLGMVAGAGAAGLGAIGAQAQQNHYAKEQQRMSAAGQQVVMTPGLMSPGTFSSDPTLETVAYSRDKAFGSAIKQM